MDWLRSRWDWIVRNKFLTCVIAFAAGLLIFGVVMVCQHWGWIVTESGSTIIRNLGLVAGGLIAIGFGIWRGVVASRQAKTSQSGLLNERYQKGAEMLGSEVLSVRLGGIYALQSLAEDDPEQYHVKTMRLLCAFVRHLTEDKDYMAALKDTEQQLHRLREDVQAAMTAIGTRSEDDMELEKQGKFSLILNDAQLNGADLTDAYLTDTHLDGAYLNRALLDGAYLTGAYLNTAHLNAAHLNRAHLEGAHLTCAHLNRTYLIGAHLEDAHLEDAHLLGAHLEGAHLNAAHLEGAHLEDAYLLGAHLEGAHLNGADLTDAHLNGAHLNRAHLTDAHLNGADLNGALLTDAHLNGADFSEAKGLTQKKLDQARADPGNPPQLGGLCDVETGEPLEWRGGVPSERS